MHGQKSWGAGTWEDSAEGVVLVAVPDVVHTVLLVVLAVFLIGAVLSAANIVATPAVLRPTVFSSPCSPYRD